ncbi:unnamed protein product (macronuclear) [Paramecium tetraurelia]|nr:uncharacterized protein GSPATT00020010001 [Paramecium tetraurelia]CAK86329.1 unnamed protein product [Paramecium tetraurelia]|eukprot:XP_001453726.1 hypothetical protein (macronuclear) [Paramecium tetraurelia strain d4-2]
MKLKGACPDKRLPKGILSAGKTAITDALADFNIAKTADIVNEKMPSQAQIPQQSVSIKKPSNTVQSKKK